VNKEVIYECPACGSRVGVMMGTVSVAHPCPERRRHRVEFEIVPAAQQRRRTPKKG
jgi:predicted RNA-binding Zn-ribbon protein involved in translation (DUF1610 family)